MTLAKKDKNPWWRPELCTKDVVAKLEFAFANSFTDEEACLYAWISKNTLYRYIEKNPEFWNQKELLKKSPNLKAKLNWINKINSNDYTASKDWLERKSRDEFSLKQEIDNKMEWEIKIITNVEIL